MADETKPATSSSTPGDKKGATSALNNALTFLQNPDLAKNIQNIEDIVNDQGLTQSQKEKLVADLQERDKKRQEQIDALNKDIEAKQKTVTDDEALLKQLRDAAQKLQTESAAIEARMAERQEFIDKALAAAAGHGKAADDLEKEAAERQKEIDKLMGKG